MKPFSRAKALFFGVLGLRYRTPLHHRRSVELYRQFIKPGEVVFDVGAHVGGRTALFLEAGARVVAVEPQRSCLVRLRERFKGDPRVKVVPKALGARPGHSELAICADATTISTMSPRWRTQSRFAKDYEWQRTERVPVATLETLIRQFGMPAFCKIDVEGFELEVLRGLRQPVRVLSFEFVKEFLGETEQCLAYLKKLGPVEFNCSIGETMRLVFPDWVGEDELLRRLRAFRLPHLWGDIYVRFQSPRTRTKPKNKLKS